MRNGRRGWRDDSRSGPMVHPTPPVKYATTAQIGKLQARTYSKRRPKTVSSTGCGMVTYAFIPEEVP